MKYILHDHQLLDTNYYVPGRYKTKRVLVHTRDMTDDELDEVIKDPQYFPKRYSP